MASISVNNIYNINGTLTTDSVVWEIPIKSNVDNPGAFVEVQYPTDFAFNSSEIISNNPSSYDDGTKIWTIPLDADEVAILKLTLDFTPPVDLEKTYEFLAGVNGLDTDPSNNGEAEVIEYKSVITEPLGGANPDQSSCLCVDVSTNDTSCSQGTTEWRLDETSIVNGILQSWDVSTGQGNFTAIDPTQPITFEYDLFCVIGTDEYEISCDVPVQIYPQLDSIDIFNHTIHQVDGADLTPEEITLLEAEYQGIDLTLYTWNLLRNGAGVTTSGVPLPIYNELSGYLCTTDDTIVFVWNNNGDVSFKLADGTDFLGDPLSLADCCCQSN